ncbi:unnamed protein product [Prorocentrum cordatum]|uniref:Uncharacterized protein n=1 Tax=Prorocentrum cordatum TaxID=2364126 RepID=A0ABN9USB5_9DINO|nr:unnamed protein product [Polarella glacialis]
MNFQAELARQYFEHAPSPNRSSSPAGSAADEDAGRAGADAAPGGPPEAAPPHGGATAGPGACDREVPRCCPGTRLSSAARGCRSSSPAPRAGEGAEPAAAEGTADGGLRGVSPAAADLWSDCDDIAHEDLVDWLADFARLRLRAQGREAPWDVCALPGDPRGAPQEGLRAFLRSLLSPAPPALAAQEAAVPRGWGGGARHGGAKLPWAEPSAEAGSQSTLSAPRTSWEAPTTALSASASSSSASAGTGAGQGCPVARGWQPRPAEAAAEGCGRLPRGWGHAAAGTRAMQEWEIEFVLQGVLAASPPLGAPPAARGGPPAAETQWHRGGAAASQRFPPGSAEAWAAGTYGPAAAWRPAAASWPQCTR